MSESSFGCRILVRISCLRIGDHASEEGRVSGPGPSVRNLIDAGISQPGILTQISGGARCIGKHDGPGLDQEARPAPRCSSRHLDVTAHGEPESSDLSPRISRPASGSVLGVGNRDLDLDRQWRSHEFRGFRGRLPIARHRSIRNRPDRPGILPIAPQVGKSSKRYLMGEVKPAMRTGGGACRTLLISVKMERVGEA